MKQHIIDLISTCAHSRLEKEIQTCRSVKCYKMVHVVRAALSLGPSWACLVPNCQWLEKKKKKKPSNDDIGTGWQALSVPD